MRPKDTAPRRRRFSTVLAGWLILGPALPMWAADPVQRIELDAASPGRVFEGIGAFEENFENYRAGDTPRYFADQKGTFEVCPSPQGGLCLAQIVPEQGILWFAAELFKPHTLFGDTQWRDREIEADVLLAGGDVEIGGRYADRAKLGYRWILTRDGRWQLNWQYTSLASGQIEAFKPAQWHHLRLTMKGNRIAGFVDGKPLAAVTDASGAMGMAFLASTYDRNLFDNVRVGPIVAGAKSSP